MNKKIKKANSGYTLIEIMVCIAIVSILCSMVAVTMYSFKKGYNESYKANERITEEAYIKKCISDCTNMANGGDNYNNTMMLSLLPYNENYDNGWQLNINNNPLIVFEKSTMTINVYSLTNGSVSTSRKLKFISDIKLSKYSEKGLLVKIIFDNKQESSFVKYVINFA